MTTRSPRFATCPKCLALNGAGATRCFVCAQPFPEGEMAVGIGAGRAGSRGGVRLGAMMLLIGLIGVFLGLARWAPLLAIGLAIPAIVAIVRTFFLGGSGREGPVTTLDHAAVFLMSLAIAVAVLAAAVVAFLVTFVPIAKVGRGHDLVWPGVVCGGVVGLVVAAGLTVLLVREDRRASRKSEASRREGP